MNDDIRNEINRLEGLGEDGLGALQWLEEWLGGYLDSAYPFGPIGDCPREGRPLLDLLAGSTLEDAGLHDVWLRLFWITCGPRE